MAGVSVGAHCLSIHRSEPAEREKTALGNETNVPGRHESIYSLFWMADERIERTGYMIAAVRISSLEKKRKTQELVCEGR
jgi:hypothetical protein